MSEERRIRAAGFAIAQLECGHPPADMFPCIACESIEDAGCMAMARAALEALKSVPEHPVVWNDNLGEKSDE